MFQRSNHRPNGTDLINQKIKLIKQATEISNVRSIKNFDTVLERNPHRQNIQGHYVEICLSEYQTFVPNGSNFADRYDQPYQGGPFDVPLFTLKEWRDRWEQEHRSSNKPDLLVNANWFNVWSSGVPNQGEKINPRTQARTYLMGLSISDGELVSSHKVLDQNNVGLDTIIFDTLNHQAMVISHQDIDVQVKEKENLYANKNAVSGFIILKDRTKQKTPHLNNNHSNRLPRTGIGYKNDGKNIVVMVIHNEDRNHGVTAEEFADLFAALNCTHAINLDNSGSVELFYNGLGEFGKKNVTINTKTCDAGTTTERPKPNFIGFKNVAKYTIFAKDDSDNQRKIVDNKKLTSSKTDDDVNYTFYIKR